MPLPEVKSSLPEIPVFTSEPRLTYLALILATLLTLNHTNDTDIQRVFEFVQIAYERGILTGMERTLSKFETAALKKLDTVPPAEVN